MSGIFGQSLSGRFFKLFLILASFSLCQYTEAPLAQSQVEPGINEFIDALEAIDKKAYEEAEASLLRALELSPKNLEYKYHLGVVKSLRGEETQALDILRSIIENDPKGFLKAFLEISGIYMRQRRYSDAEANFEMARKYHEDSGRLHLDYANLLKDMGKYDQALEHIEKAIGFDQSIKQSGLLLKGVIEIEMNKFEDAVQSLNECIRIDPQNPSANLASNILRSIPAIKKGKRPFYATLNFSWTYDDNVALEPLEDIAKTGLISHKSDQFETLFLKAGYKLFRSKKGELSIGYGVYNVGYKDRVENNVFAHVPFLMLSLSSDKLTFAFPYEYYYFKTGGKDTYQDSGLFITLGKHSKKKLKLHSFTPMISIPQPNAMRTDIGLIFQDKEYLDKSPDSKLYGLVLNQSFFTDKMISPKIGIKVSKEDSESNQSAYNHWEVMGGLELRLPFELLGNIAVSYAKSRYDYNDPVSFPQWYGKRKDTVYNLNLGLSKTLWNMVVFYCNYGYTHNNSNALGPDPYNFEKNIFTLGTVINF